MKPLTTRRVNDMRKHSQTITLIECFDGRWLHGEHDTVHASLAAAVRAAQADAKAIVAQHTDMVLTQTITFVPNSLAGHAELAKHLAGGN